MPSEPGTWIERHEAERLRLCGVDNLPDVNTQLLAHERELVDEADVHSSERVLEQLHHLGHARGADGHDGVDRSGIKRARELGARWCDTADTSHIAACFWVALIARSDRRPA